MTRIIARLALACALACPLAGCFYGGGHGFHDHGFHNYRR